MGRPVTRHAPARMTRQHNRTAAQGVLIHRDDLDAINIESFCRSYGLREDEARKMIGEERRRRKAREVACG